MKRRLRDVPPALAMLVPSMALLAVWTVYPLVMAFINGTKSCDSTGRRCNDVGWQQFSNVWQSREFQHAPACR